VQRSLRTDVTGSNAVGIDAAKLRDQDRGDREAGPATVVGVREVPAALAAKLRAVADSFVESFDGVRMEDIAAASGVARATLYYYFSGKDDVLTFLLRSMLDELASTAAAAADGPGDAPTRLRAVIRNQLDHLDAHPTTSQMLIANLGRAGKLPDIAARVNEGFRAPVRRLLAEGAAEGTLRQLADPDLGATALFGAVLVVGLQSLVISGRIDVDAVIDSIGPMFWLGIGPETRLKSRSSRKPKPR
jgi:AcrR family transcriptional regulator